MGTLSDLSPVKKHLLRASREVLMAVHSLLGFADQFVSGHDFDTLSPVAVKTAISYAQKTLKRVTQMLPQGADEVEYRALHRKVVNSILEVLEGEIQNHSRRLSNPKIKMKVEVLQAIRGVLLKEMYEQEVKDEVSSDDKPN